MCLTSSHQAAQSVEGEKMYVWLTCFTYQRRPKDKLWLKAKCSNETNPNRSWQHKWQASILTSTECSFLLPSRKATLKHRTLSWKSVCAVSLMLWSCSLLVLSQIAVCCWDPQRGQGAAGLRCSGEGPRAQGISTVRFSFGSFSWKGFVQFLTRVSWKYSIHLQSMSIKDQG